MILLLLLLLLSLNDFEKRRNGVFSKNGWRTVLGQSSEEIVCLAFVYSVNRSRESNLWKEAQQ